MEAFGLESLEHQQREAIREFVSGRDVFVALPTGFGKSLFFLRCSGVRPSVCGQTAVDYDDTSGIALQLNPCMPVRRDVFALYLEKRDRSVVDYGAVARRGSMCVN